MDEALDEEIRMTLADKHEKQVSQSTTEDNIPILYEHWKALLQAEKRAYAMLIVLYDMGWQKRASG